MMKRICMIGTVFIGMMANVGCTHMITITSDPPGARVSVNGNEVGVTPFNLEENMAPGSAKSLELRLDGYRPFVGHLEKSYDWPIGCLTVGLAGLACGGIQLATLGSGLGWLVFVPAVGAAVFDFKSPDRFHATLQRSTADGTGL